MNDYKDQFSPMRLGLPVIERLRFMTIKKIVSAAVADFFIVNMVSSGNWDY